VGGGAARDGNRPLPAVAAATPCRYRWTLYHRELTITATYSSSPSDLVEAFRLIAGGGIEVERLITHRVPLASPAVSATSCRREALKVYVTP
jgi:threonine dehydrogenase-like Zn-dependent dehydrogenase